MQNTKKGAMNLEIFAYGILIVAVVIIVGVYLVTQLSTQLASTNATVIASEGNVTAAFLQFATLLGLIVLVGVIGIVIMLLRSGIGGGATAGGTV